MPESNFIILCISLLICFFAAGLADGTADRLQFRLPPSLRGDQFFDPRVSWQNKWKNRDPKQGPRFPGSTTLFVFLTDGWHLAKFARNAAYLFASAAAIAIPSEWRTAAVLLSLGVVARGAGFTLMWNINHPKK